MKKVAIVIGHTKDSKGASSKFLPPEFDFNKNVAGKLKEINTGLYDIYEHDTYSYGYNSMIKRTADKINSKNYDLILELHYNAASPLANGCETLYYFASKKGKQYAEQFSQGISTRMGVSNRGIRALITSQDRGFASVYYPRATALILEPFFGSNSSDAAKFKNQEGKYAGVINDIVLSLEKLQL